VSSGAGAADEGFEFVEGPTGDLSFVARGQSLEAVFAAAAEALLAVTVDDPTRVQGAETRELVLDEPDVELLLLRFLNELVWLRDAEELLLRVDRIEVTAGPPAGLRVRLVGQHVDPAVHGLRSDVKAATAHGLRIVRMPAGFEGRFTFDV
jgi:SHS2 domain-containing protein